MNKFKRILSFMFIFIFVLAPFSHAANDVLLAENTGIVSVEKKDGFNYTLIDEEGNTYSPIVKEDKYIFENLKDGKYTLKETERPKGYTEAREINLTLPYDEEGSRSVVVEPKPIKEDVVIKENDIEYAKTAAQDVGIIGPIFIVFTLLLIVGGIFMAIIKRR